MPKKSNWVERPDGWHKRKVSHVKGNAHFFSKPIPPVRDAATGHPIGRGGVIDWLRVILESNKRHGRQE